MDRFSIYVTGVGGQGIGLLSEIILRAADHAGHKVKGVDTHGLAQRGGIVISCIRIGEGVYTPLIPAGEADLVVALERHEALRGLNQALRDGGTLLWYDTAWQPLEVRLGTAEPADREKIAEACKARKVREIVVSKPDLTDPRMQNIVLLASLVRFGLVPEIGIDHYLQAMDDLMAGRMLEENTALFRSEAQEPS